MDPKDAEELCNTGPDEETIAREKKRLRRVSFADITSVHVFDRDEDYETPPDSKPSSDNPDLGQSNSNDRLEFLRYFVDSDDSKESMHNDENEEDDDEDQRELFVRDMDSFSPGSAIGSATSIDEDNFFGPVSASFIRSGRLSDPSPSDSNHDITMDSTTFSMHFRSLVQSDSGGNFKTPTGFLHNFEEKTPTDNSMPTHSGSYMVLTGVKKPIPRDSVSGGNSSGGSDSNDMSLIEANPQRYDYGRLSPTLDALLAEGSKDLHAVSVAGEMSISKSSNHLNDELKTKHMLLNDTGDREPCNIDTQETLIGVVSEGNIELIDASGRSATTPTNQISYNFLVGSKDTLDASTSLHTQTLNKSTQGMSFGLDKELDNGAFEASGRKLEFGGCNSDSVTPLNNTHQMGLSINHDFGSLRHFQDIMREESPKGGRYTPIIGRNTNQCHGSPVKGSISSLHTKRRQIFLDSSISARSERVATPFARKPPCSFSNKENITHNESISSIQKSMSKFEVLKVSCSSAMVGVSFNGSEEYLSSVGQRNSKQRSSTEMESCVVGTPKNIRTSEESVAKEPNEECSYHISSGMPCNEQPSKLMAVVAPRLPSHDPIEGALVTTELLSSLMGITVEENNQVASRSDKFIHSPLNRLERKLSASPEWIQDLVDTRQNGINMSHSTPMAERPINLGSSLRENGVHATMPFLDANGSLNIGKSKGVSFKNFLLDNIQQESGNIGEYSTPLRHGTTLSLQSGNSDMIFRTGTDPSKFKERVFEKASLYESASPYVRKRTATATRLEKRLVERLVRDPSRKETHNLAGNDTMHRFVGKDSLSATAIQCSDVLEPFSVQEVDGSGRKRKIEEIILMDKDMIDETRRIQKSPKVAIQMEGSVSEFHSYLAKNNEVEDTGGNASPRHWGNVFSKKFGATKGLLLPSVDRFNSRELDVLDDILGRLQKTKKYEKLHTDTQSQRIHDHLGNLRQKRVAEATCLQLMLVYEQAKSQLLLIKQERLHKKVQLLQSGIQECQKLKFSCLQNVCMIGARDAQNKGTYDEVIRKRQELGALDKKVQDFTKSFLAYHEIKGEPSPSETIVLLHDHLRKRIFCRFILQELQLWKVDSLESKGGHYNLVLNYRHFLLQRFAVDLSLSNMVSLSKLNDANILKSFPNINTCAAFAFVFNAETARSRKLGGSKSLAVGTQIINSLLGNLLDVVEEVQVACEELRNLIETRFHSPCDEQLELQLCFIEFKTGNKMTLTLDMTCLNRGVYPSEIIPRTYVSQTPESLSAEIAAAVGVLKVGHLRIIRLCRCVSQVVQASSS